MSSALRAGQGCLSPRWVGICDSSSVNQTIGWAGETPTPLSSSLRLAVLLIFTVLTWALDAEPVNTGPNLRPVVEAEEDIYTYQPANNGAGPLWCHGSTCLVRIGDDVFASGLETLENAKPLNNCRWTLYQRDKNGWQLQQADPTGRTREPCPLAGFPDGRLFLSVNPTLTEKDAYSGPARPEILQFAARDAKAPFERLLPVWDGTPAFTEHSYRSFAADGPGHELILLQNIGYTHAEWTFRDRTAAGPPKANCAGRTARSTPSQSRSASAIRTSCSGIAPSISAASATLSSRTRNGEPTRSSSPATNGTTTSAACSTPGRRTSRAKKFRPWVEIASRDKTCGGISAGRPVAGPGRRGAPGLDRARPRRAPAREVLSRGQAKPRGQLRHRARRQGCAPPHADAGGGRQTGRDRLLASLSGHTGQPALRHLLRERHRGGRQNGCRRTV